MWKDCKVVFIQHWVKWQLSVIVCQTWVTFHNLLSVLFLKCKGITWSLIMAIIFICSVHCAAECIVNGQIRFLWRNSATSMSPDTVRACRVNLTCAWVGLHVWFSPRDGTRHFWNLTCERPVNRLLGEWGKGRKKNRADCELKRRTESLLAKYSHWGSSRRFFLRPIPHRGTCSLSFTTDLVKGKYPI